MARKKQRDDEDDDRDLDDAEEAADVEDDAVTDDETALEDEPVDEESEFADEDEPADDEAVDEPVADDAPPEEPEEEEEEDVELPPRPRTPIFTIVLLVLNFLAVPGFLVLLVMDYSARQQWSYATFLNRLYAVGLPLSDEEDAAPAAFATRPRLRIDSDRLKEAYNKRPKAQGTPSITEQFVPVDTFDEPVNLAIRPSQVDDQVKRDLFAGVGTPVGTLDEEIARLKASVPQAIQKAAEDYAPANKKQAVEAILLPMAWKTAEVVALQDRIDKASADPAALDALLKDTAERRMLTDVLAPLNIYRPEDAVTTADPPEQLAEKFIVEKVADKDVYPIEKLRELLQKRFDAAVAKSRDDVDRRHQIAFLMLTLSRVKTPDGKELLPNHFQRSQVVCGLYEFTQAAANYPRTLHVLNQRVLDAIDRDRAGYVVLDKNDPTKVAGRTEGFVDQLAADIDRLRKVKTDIDFTVKRIKHLETQRDRYDKEYNERLALLTEVTKKLVDERGKTAKVHVELKQLQQELFESQQYLSDAAARNARLEVDIVSTEKKLLLPKGVKKQ